MGIESPKFETQSKFKETSKEKLDKETIKDIESASIHYLQDKIDMILILKELKPASEVSLCSEEWREGEKEKEIDSQKLKDFEELLNKTGISHEPYEKKTTNTDFAFKENDYEFRKRQEATFLIAKDKESLNLLKEALKTNDEELMGRAYGYPESAIKAFCGKKETIEDAEELPEEIKRRGPSFLRFKLSKNNWQEEIKLCEKWAEAIKEASPKLYRKFYKKDLVMSFEKPQIEQAPEIDKEARIKDIEKQVDEIRDALGKPIDLGIKKAVIALNLWEFSTSQSCEGHSGESPKEEGESKTPWIDIEALEPKDWKENKEVQEKWREENLKKQVKMINFLDEFYKNREVPFDVKLQLDPRGIYGGFLLQSQGAETISVLLKEEQERRRELYRKEMNNFADFLKDKFLKNKK